MGGMNPKSSSGKNKLTSISTHGWNFPPTALFKLTPCGVSRAAMKTNPIMPPSSPRDILSALLSPFAATPPGELLTNQYHQTLRMGSGSRAWEVITGPSIQSKKEL